MHPDLELALELADHADTVTMNKFGATDLVVETKPDRTPVSEADKAAEQLLREGLKQARPEHAVLGEEFGTEDGDGVHRWILDPIDGTKNYVRGMPVWATLIALETSGVMEVGVVSAPALGRRWFAARDEGAYLNGERLQVSAVSELSDAFLGYDDVASFDAVGLGDEFLGLTRACWRSRGVGDFWSHMLVAEGVLDIAVEPGGLQLYDLAPIQLVVDEAGGRFTDLGGARTADGGSAISTNGLLHDTVVRTFSH